MRLKLNPRFAMLKDAPGALLPTMKKKRVTRSKVKESTIQSLTEQYLDALGLFYIRIPDELLRVIFPNPAIPIHVKAVIADHLKGLPDLLLLKDGRYKSLELKTLTGKIGAAQKQVGAAIGTTFCRSFEEARAEIDRFMEGKA